MLALSPGCCRKKEMRLFKWKHYITMFSAAKHG